MAEQEACTELVEKASQDQVSSTFEGESQLLPLLQGLLEAPDNEQTADSGTESGEDQRCSLIAEVQNALDKLSTNLRDDATDITPERRTSLLQLVTKLQAGLAVSVPTQQRRSSCQGRFRRRQRPNRHTVGVSSEELADARRLIEEISLHEIPQAKILQKQNSEGSVNQNTPNFKPFLTQKSVVKNATAKPFSSSNSTISGNSSSVQTPTDAESLDFLFTEDQEKKDEQNTRPSSGDVSNKSNSLTKKDEETDEDTTMKIIKEEEGQTVMQTNPLYQKFSSEDKNNKFNSKKLKMKRANTIDIPKPLNFYEDDADSDCSLPDEDYHQRRRSNYLALRGPIRVGNTGNHKTNLPIFEPKTDNDKKFLAFINKHNETAAIKTNPKNSIWAKPETIWSNKFGNIKTAFEKPNSARQFWKSTDDAVTTTPKYDGPKISKQSARNLRQMFEEKQRQAQKLPWSTQENDKNIVTGSLKVKAFDSGNDKTYKFIPQPLPVNKFSHAPQSAFKPIQKKGAPENLQISKTPIRGDEKGKDLDSPLFLYSPKPIEPQSLKPWAINPGESRVLSLAASKFENITTPEPIPVKPRKLSKDKVLMQFQPSVSEKLSAPYLVRSTEQKNSNVKQLSGQYDHGGRNDYATYSTVKYTTQRQNSDQYSGKPQQHLDNQKPTDNSYQQSQHYPSISQQYHQPSQVYTAQTQQVFVPNQKPSDDQYYHSNRNTSQTFSKKPGEDNYYHSDRNPTYKPSQASQAKEAQVLAKKPNEEDYYHFDKNTTYPNKPRQGYSTQTKETQVLPKKPGEDHYYYDRNPTYHNKPNQGYSSQTKEAQVLPKKPGADDCYYSDRNQTYPDKPRQGYTAQTKEAQVLYKKPGENDYRNTNKPSQAYSSQTQEAQVLYKKPSENDYRNINKPSQDYSSQTQEVYVLPKKPSQDDYYRSSSKPSQAYSSQTTEDHVLLRKPSQDDYYKSPSKPSQAYSSQTPADHVLGEKPGQADYYRSPSKPSQAYSCQTQADHVLPKKPSQDDYYRSSSKPNQAYSSQTKEDHVFPKKPDDHSNQQEYQEPQYTSTYQYQAKPTQVKSEENHPRYDSQLSVESLKEYNAVSSRVMTGPVCQQATTVRQKSPMNRDEHDIAAALNLRNVLQKVSPRPDITNIKPNQTSPVTSPKESNTPVLPITRSEDSSPSGYISNYSITYQTPKDPPKIISPTNYQRISPKSFTYHQREDQPKLVSPHSFTYQNKQSNYSNKRAFESLEINDNGESIVTSKFQIPVINIPEQESPRLPTYNQIANKAESWKQICLQNQQPLHKPSPRASPNARTVSKSKSSHSLALPKQFEAGMSKDEMATKRKTMEAFLTAGSKSPSSFSRLTTNEKTETKTKRSINRLKTSEKNNRQSSGLSRSRTLPDIVCPQMLDETNVDKAFEELFKSSS